MKHWISIALLFGVLITTAQDTIKAPEHIETEFSKYEEQLVILGDKITAQEERVEKLKKKTFTLLDELFEIKKQELQNKHSDPALIEKEFNEYKIFFDTELQNFLNTFESSETINLNLSLENILEPTSVQMAKFSLLRLTVEGLLLVDYIKEWQECINNLKNQSIEKTNLLK